MDELETMKANMRRLLTMIGGKSTCQACKAEIWFVPMKSGKAAPFTADGVNHFANCPEASRFRRKETE